MIYTCRTICNLQCMSIARYKMSLCHYAKRISKIQINALHLSELEKWFSEFISSQKILFCFSRLGNLVNSSFSKQSSRFHFFFAFAFNLSLYTLKLPHINYHIVMFCFFILFTNELKSFEFLGEKKRERGI